MARESEMGQALFFILSAPGGSSLISRLFLVLNFSIWVFVVVASPASPYADLRTILEANLFRRQRIPLLSFSGSLHGFFFLSRVLFACKKTLFRRVASVSISAHASWLPIFLLSPSASACL